MNTKMQHKQQQMPPQQGLETNSANKVDARVSNKFSDNAFFIVIHLHRTLTPRASVHPSVRLLVCFLARLLVRSSGRFRPSVHPSVRPSVCLGSFAITTRQKINYASTTESKNAVTQARQQTKCNQKRNSIF